MDAKQKAIELITKFQQYYWNECDGFLPYDSMTKKTVNKVIDEIELQASNWGVNSVTAYWTSVRKQVNKILS